MSGCQICGLRRKGGRGREGGSGLSRRRKGGKDSGRRRELISHVVGLFDPLILSTKSTS
jgi:hypothetical protein